jgi:hypothetical protein
MMNADHLKSTKTGRLVEMLRERWLVVLAVCAALSFVPKVWMSWKNYARIGPYDQGDFNLYYFAFDTVLHRIGDISRLYDHTYLLQQVSLLGVHMHPDSMTWFGYPPPFAVLLSPLAMLGLQPAKLVWVVMSLVLLVASLVMLTRLCIHADNAVEQTRRRRAFFIVLLSLAGMNAPLYMEVQFGQANCVILFLLCATFYIRYLKHNSWLAGVPLGIAILFKLTPALIPLYFLIKRDWRLAVSTAAVCAAGTVVTAWVIGWKLVLQYPLEYLPAFSARVLKYGGAPWNSSFRGALTRIAHDLGSPLAAGAVAPVAMLFSIAILAFVASIAWRRAANRNLDMGLAVMWPLLLSPVIEQHHLVLAFIPVAATLAALWESDAFALKDPAPRARTVAADTRSVVVAVLLLAAALAILCVKPVWISYTASFGLLLGALLQVNRQPSSAPLPAHSPTSSRQTIVPVRDSGR